MHHGAGMQVGDVFFQFMIFILGLGMFIVPIVHYLCQHCLSKKIKADKSRPINGRIEKTTMK
jgi:hypothetical protein